MAGKSDRDKCFKEATDAYNDTQPDDKKIPIEHQKGWVKPPGEKWRPLGPIESIWGYIKNAGRPPYRYPDWTLTIDGKPVAGDNKFEGDEFSDRQSSRSGQTQIQDQNDMNEDQNPGKEEYQDLHLNPQKCQCDDNPKQEEVYVPDPALGLNRMMIPGVDPVFPLGTPATGAATGLVPAFAY